MRPAVSAEESDVEWMREALKEAQRAALEGEVPVGALLICNGRVIGRARNGIEQFQDPTAHAELLAIRGAAAAIGSRRLLEATLYTTLEPCTMCAGAIVLARIPRLVFGAFDPKSGACGSLANVVQDSRLNHRCEVRGGLLEKECAALLRRFFVALRSADR